MSTTHVLARHEKAKLLLKDGGASNARKARCHKTHPWFSLLKLHSRSRLEDAPRAAVLEKLGDPLILTILSRTS